MNGLGMGWDEMSLDTPPIGRCHGLTIGATGCYLFYTGNVLIQRRNRLKTKRNVACMHFSHR
uniref:Uncharacterized protein n=1 Tax=Picea sitchensis TaxID=3332 RepID=A0A6B9XRG1_PICSI|nr:hypothetical protein Q903MT_gene4242 [Picea sitchensis]